MREETSNQIKDIIKSGNTDHLLGYMDSAFIDKKDIFELKRVWKKNTDQE